MLFLLLSRLTSRIRVEIKFLRNHGKIPDSLSHNNKPRATFPPPLAEFVDKHIFWFHVMLEGMVNVKVCLSDGVFDGWSIFCSFINLFKSHIIKYLYVVARIETESAPFIYDRRNYCHKNANEKKKSFQLLFFSSWSLSFNSTTKKTSEFADVLADFNSAFCWFLSLLVISKRIQWINLKFYGFSRQYALKKKQ